MTITEIPFGQPGRAFRSPMPFSNFDPDEAALDEFRRNRVNVVVMLTSDEEARARSGRDLRQVYEGEGLEVIHLPIVDFDTPKDAQALEAALGHAAGHLAAGRNVAVHCYAGMGRTGMFIALMGKRLLGMTSVQAIEWVRGYVPGAVQTTDQAKVVAEA